MVGASHRNLAKVRELVERQPALARSAVDWGFGDWESALGAAAHTGRREIAELLLANGAQPTLFSAAMLGHLDVVRAFVDVASGHPGHPRPARHHRCWPTPAPAAPMPAAVVSYLEGVGGADVRTTTQPLAPADRDAVVGRYVFGAGPRDRLRRRRAQRHAGHRTPEADRRGLRHHTGDLVFFPSGVPTVKIAFAREGGKVVRLSVADPHVLVTATRI